MKLTIQLSILFIFLTQILSAQYLHQKGKFIVDGNDKEVLLRGIGLGGWMLQEGYMMESSGFANTQKKLKAKIELVAGKAGLDAFYDAWLKNYCQKADIDSMAKWGFNSVRLPMHYNLFTLPIEDEPISGEDTWLTKGFELTDSLLDWCAANHMYLILDLHATPGGQGKDEAISDYDPSLPSLWESAENRRKTIALWKKLAEHYANEPWIGGYDLINETNWTLSGNTLLKNLHKDITTAIWEVDQNHLIIIEGNGFANDYAGLTPPWDSNMAYSFHKYWNYNDTGSIQWVLNLRNQYNVPLWLGESGENSNVWFTQAIGLVEANKIGWAWWPYKKISSVVGTVTIPKTTGYQALLNYWNNGGTKPSAETATTYLLEQAEMLKLENCIIHYDVLDAMFRQAQGDKSPKPFKKHSIPGLIYATDYDLGGNNYAYFDTDTARYGDNSTGNTGYAYRNDGVDIEACKDASGTNGYSVGWTNDTEWMLYTVDVDSSAIYQLDMRYAASGSTGKFHIESDGTEITPVISTSASGGWAVWKTLSLTNVILTKGKHKLKLVVDKAGFNINSLKFYNPQELVNVSPEILNIKTDAAGTALSLISNVNFDLNAVPAKNDFELSVNGKIVEVDSAYFDPVFTTKVILKISQQLKSVDVILLSYNGTILKSEDEIPFDPFSRVKVMNNSPLYYQLPGTVQAEDYIVNSGLSSETCTDTGGGFDMGYTNAGDYLDFLVYVPANGTYSFECRVAANVGGKIEFRIVDDPSNPQIISTVNLTSTGGWQSWKSFTANGLLKQGTHTLRMYVKQAEFNLNWFKVALVTGIKDISSSVDISIFPNPAQNQITLQSQGLIGYYSINIINLQGVTLKKSDTNLNPGSPVNFDISDLADGIYIFILENSKSKYQARIIKMS